MIPPLHSAETEFFFHKMSIISPHTDVHMRLAAKFLQKSYKSSYHCGLS